MRVNREEYIYVTKFDKDHLLSKQQIEIVKSFIRKGTEISFEKVIEGVTGVTKRTKIEGVVDKTYDNIFLLTNGRSYTYVDYILGNDELLDYLKKYHPIELYEYDPTHNFHAMNMARVD